MFVRFGDGAADCFVAFCLRKNLLATTENFASLRATTLCGDARQSVGLLAKDYSALGVADSFVPPEAGLGKTVFVWFGDGTADCLSLSFLLTRVFNFYAMNIITNITTALNQKSFAIRKL